MKTVVVSDKCAETIEFYRKDDHVNYDGEIEGILEVISKLNGMICYARETPEVGVLVDGLLRAQDVILEYFGLLQNLTYECDLKDFGRLTVEHPED